MSTPAHTISASIIALYMMGATPADTHFIVIALISATIADLDHPYLILKNRKRFRENESLLEVLDEARSIFHELPGYLMTTIAMFVASFFSYKIAFIIGVPFIIHLIQDLFIGTTYPMMPVSNIRIRLFPQTNKVRIRQEVFTYISSFILWLIFFVA